VGGPVRVTACSGAGRAGAPYTASAGNGGEKKAKGKAKAVQIMTPACPPHPWASATQQKRQASFDVVKVGSRRSQQRPSDRS